MRFYTIVARLLPEICGACGLPIISKLSHPEFSVPLGILDDNPNVGPTLHCFVASNAPWFGITDTLPQFPELSNSYQKTAADRVGRAHQRLVWVLGAAPYIGLSFVLSI